MAKHHPLMPRFFFSGGDGPDPQPPGQMRVASATLDRSIHSGHSLTDAYIQTGPWPGSMRILGEDQGLISGEDRLIKSTIPGSPIWYRWDNQVENEPSANQADARVDISEFQTLMITEAGPPPHVDDTDGMRETLDYLCRFAANLIENGAGNDLILWSIWPDLRGPGVNDDGHAIPPDWQGYTFRTGLPEYTRSFKFMADYVTWKMRQVYPSLPEDWRVWLIPGSEWMARVYDDVQAGSVSGVTDISDLFDDNIHPNSVGGYGLSVFALTSLYHHHFLPDDQPWVAPDMPQGLAEYFWGLASDLARLYEPVGMGGTQGAAPVWTLAGNGDLLPDWEFNPDPGPGPDPGELPEAVLSWTAQEYQGPALTGDQPIVDGSEVVLDGAPLSASLPLTGMYVAMSVRLTGGDTLGYLLAANSNPGGAWQAGSVMVNRLGTANNAFVGIQARNPGWDDGLEDSVGTGNRDYSSARLVELWCFNGNSGAAIDGVDLGSSQPENIPSTTHIEFFRGWDSAEPVDGVEMRFTALRVHDTMPTPGDRVAIRSWVGDFND